MCLTGICNYPYQTNIRRFTAWRHRGPKIQSRGTLCGLSPQNEPSTPKWKCETL